MGIKTDPDNDNSQKKKPAFLPASKYPQAGKKKKKQENDFMNQCV